MKPFLQKVYRYFYIITNDSRDFNNKAIRKYLIFLKIDAQILTFYWKTIIYPYFGNRIFTFSDCTFLAQIG